MPRSRRTIRRTQLASREPERDYSHLAAGERLAMVEVLTRTAWAFHTGESSEPRLEMLDALSDAGAEFLVVGAHALAVHGRPRATGDLDIWVRPTPEDAARVWKALVAFGAPLDELNPSDLATEGVVYQIGRAPDRVDLLTSITGVGFDEAWPARVEAIVDGRAIPILGREQLIANKRAVGRLRDLADVEDLEGDDE